MLDGDYDFEVANIFNQMEPIEATRTTNNNRRMSRSYLRNAFRRAHRRRRNRAERRAIVNIARRRGLDIANRVGAMLGQSSWNPTRIDTRADWLRSYAPGGSRAPTGPPQNEATAAIWGNTSVVSSGNGAFPANHHSGHPVSNARRGVGVNTNEQERLSREYQKRTGGNVNWKSFN